MTRSIHRILPLLLGLVSVHLTLGCSASKAALSDISAPAAEKEEGSSAEQLGEMSAVPPKVHSKRGHISYAIIWEEGSKFAAECADIEQKGNYDALLELTERWQKEIPDSASAAYDRGTALFYLGRFAEAIPAWQKGAILNPELDYAAKQWIYRAKLLQERYPHVAFPPAKWTRGDLYEKRMVFTKKARALLAAKKWDEIEKIQRELVQSHRELVDGSWELTWFFGGVWGDPAAEKTEATWRKQRNILEAWSKARPKSNLAKLMAGRSWVDGAWLARGNNYAAETADASFKRMEERLAHATAYFRDSVALADTTPMWAGAFQQYSQLAQVDEDSYNAVVDAAMKRFPTYTNFSVLKSVHLAPRWSGEPGDWERFAANRANTVSKARGAVEGDIYYARIVWGQQAQFKFANIWEETEASWPRTKRGLLALQTRYPDSLAIDTLLMMFMGMAREFEGAKPVLDKVQGRVDNFQWEKLGDFYEFRIKVLEKGVKPIHDPDSGQTGRLPY